MSMVLQQTPTTVDLKQLMQGFAELPEQVDIGVSGISTNSRQLGPGYVFVALAGLTRNAIDFVPEAADAGASVVLYDARDKYAAGRQNLLARQFDLLWLPVENLQQVTGEIAARFYANPSDSMRLVGITGTDGKTSVTHLLVQALIRSGRRAGSIGTLGHGVANRLTLTPYTTPDAVSVQRILDDLNRQQSEFVIMEVSSHALQQYRVSGCHFDVAVLTNLGIDHLDYHGSEEQYAAAKSRLFALSGLKGRVLNARDRLGQELALQYPGPDTLLFDAVNGAPRGPNRISLVDSTLGLQGLDLGVNVDGRVIRIRTQLIGSFNIENLLACIAVLRLLGLTPDEIEQSMQGLTPIPGRMQYYPASANQPAVVIDFAHTAQALEACLRALRPHCQGQLYCVFGCGGDRDQSKRPRMGHVAEQLADHVVITDDNPRSESPQAIVNDVLEGLTNATAAKVIHDRAEAIQTTLNVAGPNDLVVLAGKGHEQVQIVGGQRIPYSDDAVVSRLRGEASI